MQWPMDVDFVKYLSGKSSKLLKVKHHDIPGVILPLDSFLGIS